MATKAPARRPTGQARGVVPRGQISRSSATSVAAGYHALAQPSPDGSLSSRKQQYLVVANTVQAAEARLDLPAEVGSMKADPAELCVRLRDRCAQAEELAAGHRRNDPSGKVPSEVQAGVDQLREALAIAERLRQEEKREERQREPRSRPSSERRIWQGRAPHSAPNPQADPASAAEASQTPVSPTGGQPHKVRQQGVKDRAKGPGPAQADPAAPKSKLIDTGEARKPTDNRPYVITRLLGGNPGDTGQPPSRSSGPRRRPPGLRDASAVKGATERLKARRRPVGSDVPSVRS